MNLIPVITTAGLSAVFNATNNGLSATISHIALGDESWSPDSDASELRNERNRVVVSNGNRISPNQIHITAVENGSIEYWVREIGFFLDDGTLLAIWSHPTQVLAYKAEDVDLLLAFDMLLTVLPDDSVTVIGTGGVNLTPATNEEFGIVRFATDEEAEAGAINNVVMSPLAVRVHSDIRYSQKDHAHNWSDLEGIPSEFPSEDHEHTWAQISGKPTTYPATLHNHTWGQITGKPSEYNPSDHSHSWNELQAKPSVFPPENHEHTWGQISGQPSTYPTATHNHAWGEITGKPNEYNPSDHNHSWNELQSKPSVFPPENHGHTWGQISGQPTTYPPTSHTHAWGTITDKPNTYPPEPHTHDEGSLAGQTIRSIASDITQTGTTNVELWTDVAVSANTTYLIQGFVNINGVNTEGLVLDIDGPGGAGEDANILFRYSTENASPANVNSRTSFVAKPSTVTIPASESSVSGATLMEFTGMFRVGATAGNLAFDFRKVTGVSQNLVARAGGWVWVTKAP